MQTSRELNAVFAILVKRLSYLLNLFRVLGLKYFLTYDWLCVGFFDDSLIVIQRLNHQRLDPLLRMTLSVCA